MNRPISCILLILAAIVVPTAVAQESRPSEASIVVGRDEAAAANYGKTFDRLCDLVRTTPETPWIRPALRRMSELSTFSSNLLKATEALRAALASEKIDGFVRDMIRLQLAAVLLADGEIAEASQLAAGDGYVRRWRASGPFGDRSGLHDIEFAPEAEMRGAPDTDVQWLPIDIGPTDYFLRLSGRVPPRAGVFYAQAFLDAPEAVDGALTIRYARSYKVFVNGELVLDQDRTRGRLPTVAAVPVALGKGRNVLVVKFTDGLPDRREREGDLCVRFSAANGESLPAVVAGDPAAGARRTAKVRTAPVAKITSAALPHFPSADGAKGTRDERLLQALELEFDRFAPEAMEIFDAIGDDLEDRFDPVAAYVIAEFTERYDNLPDAIRTDRAKKLYEKILAEDPRFAPAAAALARILSGQEKGDQAAKLLEKTYELVPESVLLSSELRSIFRTEERRGEADALLDRELRAESPAYLTLAAAGERADGAHSRARVEELSRRLEKITGNRREGPMRRFSTACATGDAAAIRDALEKAVQVSPSAELTCYLRSEAETALWRRGEAAAYDRAQAALRELAAMNPFQAHPLTSAAELAVEAGRADDAKKLRLESLERDPSQSAVRRALALDDAEHEKIFAEYALDATAIIAEAKANPPKEYAKAPAVLLIDQMITIVEKDGSVETETHQLALINDKSGIEKWSNPNAHGDILILRTILPDGTILEPSGREGATMPGLAPGVAVEVKYRSRSWSRPGDRRSIGSFSFQDDELERGSPYRLTRSVWVLPKTTDLLFDQRHWKGGEKTIERGERIVKVFERKDVPPIAGEVHCPDGSELIESVRLGTDDTQRNDRWTGDAVAFGASVRRQSIPTPLVEKTTREVIRDAKGQTEAARAIYEWVMNEIKNPGRESNPDTVISSKSGQRMNLLAAMFTAAKIDYRPAAAIAIGDRSKPIDWRDVDAGDLRMAHLLLMPNDGPEIWVQPTARFLPFGAVAPPAAGSWALIGDAAGGRFVRTPEPPVEWGEDTTVKLTLDGEGGTADVTISLADSVAAPLKEQLRRVAENQRRQFADSIARSVFRGAKATVKSFEIKNLESRSERFRLHAIVAVERLLKKLDDGSYSMIPPFVPSQLVLALTGGKATRKLPLVVAEGVHNRMTVSIDPGEDFLVAITPPSAQITHDHGAFGLTWRLDDGVLHGQRSIDIGAARIAPDDYADFVKFCRRSDEIESMRVSLRRRDTTEAPGK